MNNSKIYLNLLSPSVNINKYKKLILNGERFLNNKENVNCSIIAPIKIGDDFTVNQAIWKHSKEALIVFTSSRIIVGQKTLLSTHFQEVLPQEILEYRVDILGAERYIVISTELATMAIWVPIQYVNDINFALDLLKNVVSEPSKYSINNRKIQNTYTSSGYFEFPETDPHGHHILKIYDLNVTGVMREFNNIRSQEIIAQLSIGDEIILEADPNNEYDSYAVKVETPNHIQIGWLPRGENLQIDISERLRSGETVYARVKKIYPLSKYPGNNGLVIDVARYSKRV